MILDNDACRPESADDRVVLLGMRFLALEGRVNMLDFATEQLKKSTKAIADDGEERSRRIQRDAKKMRSALEEAVHEESRRREAAKKQNRAWRLCLVLNLLTLISLLAQLALGLLR